MSYNPKINLANSVEGLSPRHRRNHTPTWVTLLTILFLLIAGLFWGIGKLEKMGPLTGRSNPVSLPADEMDVFRKMSFLPHAVRVEAPNFLLKTLDGQNRSLLQDRGKVVLLNFWATWCPPCVREMPSIQRLYDQFEDQGLQVVAVSVDQGNSDEVRKFVKTQELSFPVVLDPDQSTKNGYEFRALPTTYLIDRKGRVVAVGMGAREWDTEEATALISHLLREKG